ncbi:hypothetical protein [Sulfurirhabdus autotrophica]|uniref:Uncharacterized protein n=1 Tax=Sulfurirhabdus autotrophica TaxID=1706046 RepID=A0A4R3XSW1_9PROT|nr:hypothetical protein [Sulfurirhabdus autotrophica]TCV82745.1 hypothetical protein EDC63_11962 [Sulfurirhabdus autotrophica]
MIQTYWCPGPWPWQWFRMCTREVPDPPPDPCQTPECVNAKAKLAGARGRFKSNCDGLRMVTALLKLLKQILATPIWVIVVLAIIAAIISGPIAVIIWSLIALYGITWVLFLALGNMAVAISISLNQARIDVIDALKDVVANCPDQCRGDMSIPNCNLE